MAGNFIIEAWTELGIAIVFILLRLYFRFSQVGLRGMTLDDFLMLFAGALYAVETAAAHVIVAVWLGMGNNNFTPEQRAALEPGSQTWQYAVYGSKGHIVGWFMYTGLIWTLKACWTIYYSRMTDGVQKMDIRIKVAWFLNGTTYIAAVSMILFKCWPLHRQWQINPDPGNNCYPGASKLSVSFITSINTITDMYLMAIPLPIIYRAKLDIKKKISLIILFSGGWIVIIFGLLRCITLVSVGPTEPSESGQWSVRESFVAVLVSNTPMVFPLLKRWAGIASSHSASGSYPLHEYDKSDGSKLKSIGSTTMRSRGRKKSRGGFVHPLSIPNDTAWGSDEAIVGAEQSGKAGKGSEAVVQEGEERFASGRGSKSGRGVGSGSAGPGNIVMTREWQVSDA
ncbi:hypothetical protein BDU57DRAFT_478958 [Ampelomyces quisqualis]|uniref:Rhodopsin domain-containing protein n=1 Tax=Ampelomyces quisqualis TaxID=50730 RepID=A0A6A5QGG8_AMPQU|nr:hypothetical protein BDU57DRAFT_478958 [Ampelomyces quisqualis]